MVLMSRAGDHKRMPVLHHIETAKHQSQPTQEMAIFVARTLGDTNVRLTGRVVDFDTTFLHYRFLSI